MIRTTGTYRKLTKAGTCNADQIKAVRDVMNGTMPHKDLVTCTRGDNEITYYRPNDGEQINDKLYMIHWNRKDGFRTFDLYV